MRENEFELRLGRLRSRGAGGAKTFVGEALAAAARAGGLQARRPGANSVFGRGRAASLAASRAAASRARGAVVKARVVRQLAGRAPLALHLTYLQREGVTQDGARGELFGPREDRVDGAGFAARCEGDRHHFRFIVSPDDAERLSDLKGFGRDLMRQAERDLGASLDWVGVAHWNTGHPHLHIVVRGRDDQGRDLVISRDYISEGLRARAGELVTLELGPRTELEMAQRRDQQVAAERWTDLDRRLGRKVGEDGLIDMRPPASGAAGVGHSAEIARLRRLAALGLAQETAPGRWRMASDAEPILRELGRQGDVIARLHRALTETGRQSDPAQFVLDGAGPVVGRLTGRGLDDELKGSAYAVIEGIDGRTHHVRLADLADASDAHPGAIVKVRTLGERGRRLLAVRSDLDLAGQVSATGATWLDRQLVARPGLAMAETGFGAEAAQALAARTEHLVEAGLARRQGRQVIFNAGLLDTLRARELDAVARRVAADTGLEPFDPQDGEILKGRYQRRLDLASGRFAVIEGALGFALTPWRAELERLRGRELEGVSSEGAIAWTQGRTRGPAI